MSVDLLPLKQKMEQELRQDILPFWLAHSVDRENGGFYGALSNELQGDNSVVRTLVLCSRVLWTFPAAYRSYGDPAYLDMARHAYRYLTDQFIDRAFGGLYWWIDRSGMPVNDRKQTYGQAFAIYGLSEFWRATGGPSALEQAKVIFSLVEQHAFEPRYAGYVEGCTRSWGKLADMRLSDKEAYNC